MALYNGISTIDFNSGVIVKGQFPSKNNVLPVPFKTIIGLENPGSNTIKLTDIQLVERNILNHLYTPKESRVMMPNFGSNLHKILFEPLDDNSIEKCRLEIESVINYDPRVELNSMQTIPIYDLGLLAVTVSLFYLELNVTKNMNFNIEFNSA